jgi:hypothetical protein
MKTAKYKILKYQETQSGTIVGHYVNDSEGIAVEWSNKEDAERIAQLFEQNSTHGCLYKVIDM